MYENVNKAKTENVSKNRAEESYIIYIILYEGEEKALYVAVNKRS
jgi:hypothetical protein